MNKSDIKINIIDAVNKSGVGPIEDDEKKAEELQRVLLETTIPSIIHGVELLEIEVDSINSADLLVEKRNFCQVLIDSAKILREYPRGMGFKTKVAPSNLQGKVKLITFRNNMDQLGWEIISKLSILKEFIEVTTDLQKLYVVALSIRECKMSFTTNKCDHLLKDIIIGNGGGLSPRKQKFVPVVLSRAPRQVLDSTKELVDNAINRKTLSKEDRANVFREMMSDRAFQLEKDPKKFGLNLLQQRRSRMISNSADIGGSSEDNNNNNQKNQLHSSDGRIHQYHHQQSNSVDIGHSPHNSQFSPPRSPPTSPEFGALSGSRSPPPNKKFLDLLSPRSSDRILRHYKLLSSSPSGSAGGPSNHSNNSNQSNNQNSNSYINNSSNSNNSSATTQQQLLQQQLQMVAEKQEVEWEKYDIDSLSKNYGQMVKPTKGFKIDVGSSSVKEMVSPPYPVLYNEDDEFLYRDDFHKKEHYNFIGYLGGSDKTILAISICYIPLPTGELELLYIIRSQEKDERVRLIVTNKKDSISSKDSIKLIKKSRPQLSSYKFKEIKEESFANDLLDFEKKNTVFRNFKFGVLYCRAGQTEENEIYHNHEPEVSKQYLDFVSMLGERIELKGWAHYRGGLDIKDNMTGVHAIYRRWKDYEIIFHVATMIPYKEEDEQQIDRKRHLGNDIVQIIFKEGNENPFDPSICKSNFNHIFAVVQVDEENSTTDSTLYKLSISTREEVTDFGPMQPKCFSFTPNELKEFLISKLVNGERSTLKSPVFYQKFKRTRKEFLQSYYDTYVNE